MENTLEKLISTNNRGLFLLDPPTGFGKTTAVVDLIKRFLKGDPCFSGVKRMFFVTNLLTNLPYKDLLDLLTEEEKQQCFRAKATVDYVLEHFLEVKIDDSEIVNSKEYQNLHRDIESYQFTKSLLDGEKNTTRKSGHRNTLRILKQKISTDSEPAFRQFLKNKFIYNKSIQERKNFIKENGWFTYLYPICDIEKYKVIFLSTKKFISPIDTFRRVPFYAYCDDTLIKDSVVFIDEFDSTKQEFLNQIIEDGLKTHADIVSLFLNIHYALQNLTLPKKILYTSEYHKKKEAENEGKPWYTSENHFLYWKQQFENKYKSNNINYLIKSVDFEWNKAFLFDDGRYFTIIKDSSKKFIYASVDQREDILSLRGQGYQSDKVLINNIIRDLEYCIDGFTQALFYVANNFLYYKNEGKGREETQYTLEEAIYSVLDVLNLSEEEKTYLFTKIQTGDYSFKKAGQQDGMRKGFNFTEIEDSNYHDMKSVVHNYSFPTTPEDAILKLTERALVVGISATAKVETCIGNYDLPYLRSKLGDNFINICEEDSGRISSDFAEMIGRTQGQYAIHATVVDNYDVFSNRELGERLVGDLFDGEILEKYKDYISNAKDTALYYFIIELKLAFFYKEIGDKDIKSAIAFINRFPKPKDKLDLERIKEMFAAIDKRFNRTAIEVKVVTSQTFDEEFADAKDLLAQGKQVLILTTYQTVGSGKNIQYPIPEGQEDAMAYDPTDTRKLKDFEAIYVCMPTNLLQNLSFNGEDKYTDLAKYLFQQEYLYKNGYLVYAQMKTNIENGFRQVFFGDTGRKYNCNGDLYFHTLKIIIQAIGRICRCRSKNKNIYIYADRELVENVQSACDQHRPALLNEEFKALLGLDLHREAIDSKIAQYSRQSKAAYTKIRTAAYTVRRNSQNVADWQDLREFVLKNPTAKYVSPKYQDLYFEMPNTTSGYSYKQNNRYDIVEMHMDARYGLDQVSEQSCDLPIILSVPCVAEMFVEKKYAQSFSRNQFIMSPSLFKQVYLGALGEVVGKCILETQLGWDVEELDDPSFYEYFDYKMGNVYFDFKHWNEFRTDNDTYVKKVERKLAKIKGAKCFVINLVKRTDAPIKQNIGATVVQVPYLIDGETGMINDEFIDEIAGLI